MVHRDEITSFRVIMKIGHYASYIRSVPPFSQQINVHIVPVPIKN